RAAGEGGCDVRCNGFSCAPHLPRPSRLRALFLSGLLRAALLLRAISLWRARTVLPRLRLSAVLLRSPSATTTGATAGERGKERLSRDVVMAGQKREARLRTDVPAIHVFPFVAPKTWMPGTSPGMTRGICGNA